jgi:hypothetical protein
MGISASSMIVEMNLSVWTASKLDKSATETVTADNGAVANAAHVRKNLMAGTSKRKEIADFAASCRLWHNQQTLPWADRGGRLLPTSLFLDYKSEANLRRDKFKSIVQEFLDEYPALVQTAHNYLGTLFNPADYPPVEEVASKFGFRLVFSPVPEAGDFRLDIPIHDLNDMRLEYEANFQDRLADAMREPWDKLHKMLLGMSEKLTELEGEDKKIFHTTFVTNAQTMCSMLTHLNITKDPKLEAVRRDLEATMLGVDISDVRDSVAIRGDMKSRIDNILKTYEW